MKEYKEICESALSGKRRGDRTKVGTVGRFGYQMRFDLTEGFPLVTTKKVFTRGIFEELKWFLKGLTNADWLQDRGVGIWNDWALKEPVIAKVPMTSQEIYEAVAKQNKTSVQEAISFVACLDEDQYSLESWAENHGVSLEKEAVKYPTGECGPVYGKQFRRALTVSPDGEVFTVDQMKKLMHDLKIRPYSRRHIVTAWSLGELPDESISPIENVKQGRQSLAACHTFFQLYVEDMDQEEAFSRCLARAKYELGSISVEVELLTLESLELLDNALSLKSKIKERGDGRTDQESQDLERWRKRSDVIQQRLAYLKDLAEGKEKYITHLEARDETVVSLLPNKRLSCQLYQRSCDLPLGGPYNIASYAALTQLMAEMTGMLPGDFIHTFGDYHVYTNQVDILRDVQLPREPKRLPSLRISNLGIMTEEDWKEDPFKYIDDVVFDVIGYDSHPAIKYPEPAV